MSWNLYLANYSLCMLYNGVFKTHLRKLNTFWQLFLQYSWHEMTLFVCFMMESSRPSWENWIHFDNFSFNILGMKWTLFVCYIIESSIVESSRTIWKNWIHFNNSFSNIVVIKKSVISCKQYWRKSCQNVFNFLKWVLKTPIEL
jgi:hypothetical protein